jgi:glutamyl-tRNA synthetase
VAVSGAAVSPPIDQTLFLLGRTATLARLAAAAAYAAKAAPAN